MVCPHVSTCPGNTGGNVRQSEFVVGVTLPTPSLCVVGSGNVE